MGKTPRAFVDSPTPPFTYNVDFHPRRFVAQFLAHALLPFSAVIYPMLTSWRAAVRQGLVLIPVAGIIPYFGTVLFPASVWAAVGFYVVYQEELTRQGFEIVPVVVVLSLMMVHRAMIAVKYAFMSTREFEWYMYTEHEEEAKKFMQRQQLLSGWFRLTPEGALDHLRKAQARSDQSLSKATFRITPQQAKKWRDVLDLPKLEESMSSETLSSPPVSISGLDPSSIGNTAGSGSSTRAAGAASTVVKEVNGEDLLLAMLQYCDRHGSIPNSLFFWNTLILTSVQTISLLGVSRLLAGQPDFFGANWIGWTYYALTCIPVTFFFGLLVSFFHVCLQDFKRRELVYRRLGKMITPGARFTTSRGVAVDTGHKFPTIAIEDAHELESWIATRMVFTEFGAPELRRMDLYIAVAVILSFALVIWLFFLFIKNYETPRVLQSSMVLHFAFWDLFLIVGMSVLVIIFAANANDEGAKHQLLLVRLRILMDKPRVVEKNGIKTIVEDDDEIDTDYSNTNNPAADDEGTTASVPSGSGLGTNSIKSAAREAELRDKDALLDAGLELFDTQLQVRPLRFLGIRADYGLASGLLGLAMSAVLILVQRVYF